MLLKQSADSSQYLSIWIYTLSLSFMYGVSTLYHRPNWSPSIRQWFRKIDHIAIYLLIAGTVTPLATRTLRTDSQKSLLLIIWAAAALGFLQSVFWIRANKILCTALYLSMGWLIFPYLSEMTSTLDANEVRLFICGALFYGAGATVYAIKKPDPFPITFGYHEIFHLFVVFGSICHFILIQKIVVET